MAGGSLRDTFEPDIEDYYPPRFHDRVEEIDAAGRQEQRRLKGALVEEVVAWAAAEPEAAAAELAVSAKDVVDELRRIEAEMAVLHPPVERGI